MTDIYDQYSKAFARVSAFVIAKDGERVATVAIKYPADGAGRLWAYVNVLGIKMVRAYADGYDYGYDKRSEAIQAAILKVPPADAWADKTVTPIREAMRQAAENMGAGTWERELERVGFKVWQAV